MKQWIFCDSYSINAVYMEVFLLQPRVNWHSMVWNRISIPKTRFCCWLLALGRLNTKYHLQVLGILDDDRCPLCSTSKESIHHLFFECPFNVRCLNELCAWTGIRFKALDFMDFHRFKLNKLQQRVMCAILCFHSVRYLAS